MKTPILTLILSLSITLSAFAQGTSDGEPLRINHILGKHQLTKTAVVEIYANTLGEIWYRFILDGTQKGGMTIAKNTGEDTYFYWDANKSTLWVITPDTITQTDLEEKGSSSSTSQDISRAELLNPPDKVLEIVTTIRR
jgi:hypothetical protein